MFKKYWKEKHLKYKNEDWILRPTLFARDAVKYFRLGPLLRDSDGAPTSKGKILELGAGQGQDTRFFAEQGYEVVSTDLCEEGLKISKERTDKKLKKKIKFQVLNIEDDFPFAAETFDAVYAHLSLHYFDKDTTTKIFHEISRVLKKGGTFSFLVNSLNDPEYKDIINGKDKNYTKIEDDFFEMGGL
ncbi:MAG: class I SAM-dependent methyltransferase, partial [bacterium]